MKPLTPESDFHRGGEGFKVVSLVHASPRGNLYLATRGGKRFMLKTPSSEGGRELAMLQREYELSIKLSHRNVAYVYSYEADSPVGPCIAMEYVDGVQLSEWLPKHPSLRARLAVFKQILDAVEYIHDQGVIHNDLAPQNIMICNRGGLVKLIDFGFSDDDVHYLSSSMGCTGGYASPELLLGSRVDSRSDIWTLGVLMEDMFGRRFLSVSARCRRESPEGRYQSIAQLRRALLQSRILRGAASVLAVSVLVFVFAVALVLLKPVSVPSFHVCFEPVDLGLSVNWGSCNVGASCPEETGDYFAWGEITPKESYTWETYLHCSPEDTSMKKYCTSPTGGIADGVYKLGLEDDVAGYATEGLWRMPNLNEYKELFRNCRSEWTIMNGVPGMKYSSLVPGFEGKWIFLPAGGEMAGVEKLFTSGGYYWTRIKGSQNRESLTVEFTETKQHLVHRPRYLGRLVRPVQDK